MTTISPPYMFEMSATHAVKQGRPHDGFTATVLAIKARAEWVLVNGKWVPRKGVMRND